MFSLKGFSLFSSLIVLAASAAVKTPGAAWTYPASKSAYSRALGPPPVGLDTITVPYMPKSPLFPKFVDPKTMISKKTDLLSNIFGGIGPVLYPMDTKPPMPYSPYSTSGSVLYNPADGTQFQSSLSKTNVEDGSNMYKRGMLGPFSSASVGPMAPKFGPMSLKFGPMGPKFGPMGPKFGPMSPKFGPMSPKFGPMSPFSGYDAVSSSGMEDEFSRKRRSVEESTKLRAIMDAGKPDTKNLGPPPPYPTLAPIPEEPEESMASATIPKQYLPGMFGPFGPFGPFAPIVDPSMFIAKKSAFLDTLFKNIATSTTTTTTPSPALEETTTTKSTIVPPDFWFPTSIIPTPSEYSDKVADFLDKLFENLKLNKTMGVGDDMSPPGVFMRSVKSDEDASQAKIARSIDDISSISAAKDTIVDTILSELGDLKSNMVTTMNDLIAYEKSTSAAAPKKPFKPFAPGPWSKAPVDGTLPFQQKIAVLSQVFDMLSDLQKNITLSIENAMKAKMSAADLSKPAMSAYYPSMTSDMLSATGSMPINISLLDAIKSKLDSLDYEMPMSYKFGPKMARALSKSPASFWVSYPEDPAATAAKRQIDSDMESLLHAENNSNRKAEAREVKMQMHQGYQSMPSGSIESIQAGGGSVPGHQGGGMKLLDAGNYEDINNWMNWMEYLRNDNRGHRHHDHH